MQHKVLVTGAGGFLGKETVFALERDGWEVYKGLRSGISHNSVFLDLEKPKEILELIENYEFDAIVHLATKVGFDSTGNADLYIPNILSTACLLFLAKQWKARFIFASGSIVCGTKSEVIQVSSQVMADTFYGHSKWLGEELITASEVDSCILRFCGIFGANGPNHLGLNRALMQVKNGQPPKIFGGGKARRNYIYVKDAGASISAALSSHLQGIHFVAGTETLSIADMMHQLCDIFLPNQKPQYCHGSDAADQIVQPSPQLPPSRSFREALLDIKKDLIG